MISIGIVYRNPGPHFADALRSVFAQTFEDWELILTDDGSDDGSPHLAASLRDPRVRCFSDGSKKFLNVRLNEQVATARGEYFFRMDADDVMHPDRVRRQMEVLTSTARPLLVCAGAYSIDGESRVIGLRKRAGIIHPTVAVLTDWFRMNPYSEHLVYHRAQDTELWVRAEGKIEVLRLPDPLLYYREVGQFSYLNYVSSTVALLAVNHQHSGPKRLRTLGKDLAVIGRATAMSLAVTFGLEAKLVARRYHKLHLGARNAAQLVIDGVRALSVPGLERVP